MATSELASRVGFFVVVRAPGAEQDAFAEADRHIESCALPVVEAGERFLVVSTQGQGDEAALRVALSVEAEYVAFVGSRLKAQALKTELLETGVDAGRFERLHSPAGLDIGAIGPEEIALSILAEIVAFRRKRFGAPKGQAA